jgi:hypothetical protein
VGEHEQSSFVDRWKRRRRESLEGDEDVRARGAAIAMVLVAFDHAMRFFEALLIVILGDPDWKWRRRIDWSKTIFFRKRTTREARAALRRRAAQAVARQYGDPPDLEFEKKAPSDPSA